MFDDGTRVLVRGFVGVELSADPPFGAVLAGADFLATGDPRLAALAFIRNGLARCRFA